METEGGLELTEIRDLDGPNLFAPHPVIKLGLTLAPGERMSDDALRAAHRALSVELPSSPLDALPTVIGALHEAVGLTPPEVGLRWLDTPGHVAVSFEWLWRESSLAIAQSAWDFLSGAGTATGITVARDALERDRASGNQPIWVRDDQRRVPAVGITGTNGKTTTTRLLAHMLRETGKHVGWSSSSGVYIDGEQVIEGDYTGPTGARRVLEDPTIEVAVLETARGGILLRGLAYESNDVGVFLNVSADHLDMQGVETIDTLAEVKGVVVRVTRPSGVAVLNADDPLVLAQRQRVAAEHLLFGVRPDNHELQTHISSGGRAIVGDGGAIALVSDGNATTIAALADVPLTFGGAAAHMVENALAAAGAAVGLGLSIEEIAHGLQTFRSDLRSNAGRLNVFRLDGRLVVVDYAHNESGLEALLSFTRRLMAGHGKLAVILGTAGDRQDGVLSGLGVIAVRGADVILIKENPKYLRGRPLGEQTDIIRAAIEARGGRDRIAGTYPGELDAFVASLELTDDGDAIAVMCVEDQLAVYRELRHRGAEEWG
ncbi:MAG TPA: Mur ligase family protein [Thermomicrobiales bacterium]|nr:Mur ligase family protein [Thermomicrobiales bacterium]